MPANANLSQQNSAKRSRSVFEKSSPADDTSGDSYSMSGGAVENGEDGMPDIASVAYDRGHDFGINTDMDVIDSGDNEARNSAVEIVGNDEGGLEASPREHVDLDGHAARSASPSYDNDNDLGNNADISIEKTSGNRAGDTLNPGLGNDDVRGGEPRGLPQGRRRRRRHLEPSPAPKTMAVHLET